MEKDFLSENFSGGTNGEIMLNCALDALHKEDFCMADVLVISDFEFSDPSSKTVEAIHVAQSQGTKFYGLRMRAANYVCSYNQLFDKMWVV